MPKRLFRRRPLNSKARRSSPVVWRQAKSSIPIDWPWVACAVQPQSPPLTRFRTSLPDVFLVLLEQGMTPASWGANIGSRTVFGAGPYALWP